MQRITLVMSLFGFAALSACTDNELNTVEESTAVTLVYSPATGDVPLPNDVLFKDTVDATLNFPAASDPAQQPLFDALNSLDGWSTTAPMSFHFEDTIDGATAIAGDTIRVFEVTTAVNPSTGLSIGTPVVDVVAELVSPTQYVVTQVGAGDFAIIPTQPLKSATAYMVVVTNGVLDGFGDATTFGDEYGLAKVSIATNPYPADHPLVGLQLLVNAMENIVGTDADVAPAIAGADITASFAFTTQDISTVLSTSRTVALGNEAAVLAAIGAQFPGHPAGTDLPLNTVPSATTNTTSFSPSIGGFGDLFTGELTLPYYLTAAANATATTVSTDTAPLTEFWHARYTFPFGVDTEANISRYNSLPLQSGPESIPMLISMPDPIATGNAKPAGGWPVVIFQHGITSNRSSVLAIADRLALEGYAVVAIDLPLHGISDLASDPLGGALFAEYDEGATVRERTFGLDLVTQNAQGDVTAAAPDGTADTSGAHFINLSSLRTQRDNLRQGAADLFALSAVLAAGLDVDGGGVDLDPANVHFLGMSLGAIVGTSYSSLETTLLTTTLNVPGGGIPRMLEASVAFGPTVIGGLAAAGIAQGTPEFDQFMFAAQTAIDTGDPVNYCQALAANALAMTGPPILLQEVVGDGTIDDLLGLPDQVIPNSVATAPLSGTEPMIALLGLINVDTAFELTPIGGVVRFSQGAHSSLLTATPDVDGDGVSEVDGSLTAANAEMQQEFVDWINNMGTQVDVTDDSVIQ
ncbi:MAG: pimeloyl-ACP methyl ester carboxylesterase [Planctomycetota bacterium]|jgi:pimeloyl-ACP methyl ester carboxylesterase